jgi:hypothetical protein
VPTSPVPPLSADASDQLCINTMRTLSMDAELQSKFSFEPDRLLAAPKELLARPRRIAGVEDVCDDGAS